MVTGPFLPFLRGHRQAELAPTGGKGPAGGAASQGPGAFWRPRGAARMTQSCAGEHTAREALLVTAALAREAPGWRTPRRGRRGRHSGRSGGRHSPPGAVSARAHGAWGRRRRRAPGSDPGPPCAVPHPNLPGHSPRGWAAATPAAAAAAVGQAWRGLGPGSWPVRPAPWGRRGRAEDGAGAPRRQRGGGGRYSADAELTRRWWHPHSRPYKCREPALLPVGAGQEAGPA